VSVATLTDLGKISAVSEPARVTEPLLDVLEVCLEAHEAGAEVHGWAIMKATKRSGPTVYGILDRLEDAGWIEGHWEDRHPEEAKPRRRFYRLTPTGMPAARELVTARRPQSSPKRGRTWPTTRPEGLGGWAMEGPQ